MRPFLSPNARLAEPSEDSPSVARTVVVADEPGGAAGRQPEPGAHLSARISIGRGFVGRQAIRDRRALAASATSNLGTPHVSSE
jgi:hypothetical protein